MLYVRANHTNTTQLTLVSTSGYHVCMHFCAFHLLPADQRQTHSHTFRFDLRRCHTDFFFLQKDSTMTRRILPIIVLFWHYTTNDDDNRVAQQIFAATTDISHSILGVRFASNNNIPSMSNREENTQIIVNERYRILYE